MNRRGFIGSLIGAVAVRLWPKSESSWLYDFYENGIADTATAFTIEPDTPYVIFWEEMTREQLRKKYPDASLRL